MSAAHTPGPWTVSELDATKEVSEFYIFIEPAVAVIERKVEGGDEHDMPDARLIAAAPDLLAALQAVAPMLSACRFIIQDVEARQMATAAVETARAAIAKATGSAA